MIKADEHLTDDSPYATTVERDSDGVWRSLDGKPLNVGDHEFLEANHRKEMLGHVEKKIAELSSIPVSKETVGDMAGALINTKTLQAYVKMREHLQGDEPNE